MCFGGGDDGPQTNPAPYTPETSHTAVTMDVNGKPTNKNTQALDDAASKAPKGPLVTGPASGLSIKE